MTSRDESWPSLALPDWRESCETLHLWTQIVGKIRMAHAPMINHWWQVPLYVNSRGLTTSAIPYGMRSFQIDFDFIDHHLHIRCNDGGVCSIALRPQTVADFYAELMEQLDRLGLSTRIWPMPVELANPIRFDLDRQHGSYDPVAVQRFWRILVQADRILTAFRGHFLGKASPVHFFWGSFDLAVTRFSGRVAPPHPGAPNVSDRVTREAYSHEVSSCGFWPGGGPIDYPIFYAYAYPTPAGFADAPLRPDAAFFSADLGEFILPYESVRQAESPDALVFDFLQSTYEAAANLAAWDRTGLERNSVP